MMIHTPQQRPPRTFTTFLLTALILLLQACSSGGGGPAPTYTVGGSVTGLGNSPVVLQNNGSESLSISADGSYQFPTALNQGGSYSITVLTQPTGYSCSVSNGTGTVGQQNITTIAVTCIALPTYTIGGTVTGLGSNPVILQNNSSEQLSISANGSYQFLTAQLEGSSYSVTVHTQPSGYSCSVSSNTGTVAQQNITTISVNCGVTATGYYTGSADVKADNNTSNLNIPDLRAMVNGNRLMLMSLGEQLLYDGTITITGSNYSGSVTLYKSGARTSTTPVAVSGTITSASRIMGTLAGSGAGNGTFDVLYNTPVNAQAASLARVVSTVTRSYWGGAFYLPYASDTRIMYKVLEGGGIEHVNPAITGYFANCRFDGNSITPVANSAIYLFDITFSACDEVARRSNYTGLVTHLSVSAAPVVNDLLLVAFSNGESAGFAEFVYKEY